MAINWTTSLTPVSPPGSLEATIIAAHEADADTNFQGWTSDTGFTVFTETTPDAVRARVETWRASPDDLIKIICDWDGILDFTTASLRGPANTNLTVSAETIDGYVRPSGGVWLQAASGKSPVFGSLFTCFGMPRIFFDGVGFAGQANGGNGDGLQSVTISATSTFPLFAIAAFKDCIIGLEVHRPLEAGAEYVKGIGVGTGAYALHVENCEFAGCRDQIQGIAKYLRVWNCHNRKILSDFVTQFGFTDARWAGEEVFAWIEGNVLHDLIDEAGFNGLHTDFYQTGTSSDVHVGNSALIRYNIAHLKTSLSEDAATQGVYSDDHTTAKNNFKVYDNIFAVSSGNLVTLHDPSGEGVFEVMDNTLVRSGDWNQTPAALGEAFFDVNPAVRLQVNALAGSDLTANGGTVKITGNYVAAISNGDSVPITDSGNVFTSPKRAVVSGDGTSDATAKRYEDVFTGTFSRDGSDTLTYVITNENSADKATAFYAIADFFEPTAGWGVDAGPSDPETWPTAPTRLA